MKIIKIIPVATFVIMSSAHSVDGNINFTGEITANTCSINSGQTDKTINMGSVPASALQTKGQIAGSQNFTLSLKGCTGGATAVAAHFESLVSATPEGRLKLDGTSTAKNVEIAIYDNNGVAQPVNGIVPSQSYVNLVSGEAELNYVAAYYAVGAAGVGTANSTVSYSLSYQ